MEHGKMARSGQNLNGDLNKGNHENDPIHSPFNFSPIENSPSQFAQFSAERSARRTRLSGGVAQFKRENPPPPPSSSASATPASQGHAEGAASQSKRRQNLKAKASPVMQRHGSGQAQNAVDLPSHGGSPLPAPVQRKMEGSMGQDFSNVRVHQGDYVNKMGANALTQGNNIHFAPGQYDPKSNAGQKLIGHELGHVVQQSQGRVKADSTIGGVPANTQSALEREADTMGDKAAAFDGGTPAKAPASPAGPSGAVQRKAQSTVQLKGEGDKPKRKAFTPRFESQEKLQQVYGSKGKLGKPAKGKPTSTPKVKTNEKPGTGSSTATGSTAVGTGNKAKPEQQALQPEKPQVNTPEKQADTPAQKPTKSVEKPDPIKAQDGNSKVKPETPQQQVGSQKDTPSGTGSSSTTTKDTGPAKKPTKGSENDAPQLAQGDQENDTPEAGPTAQELAEQQKAAEEEAKRQKLENEVTEGIRGLKEQTRKVQSDTSDQNLKSAILQPIMEGSVFEKLAPTLYHKERRQITEQIQAQHGTKLKAAYDKEMAALTEEVKKKPGDKKAVAAWKSMKAEKLSKEVATDSTAKDLSADFALRAVKQHLLDRSNEMTDLAWSGVGGGNWVSVAHKAKGGNNLESLLTRIEKLRPGNNDLPTLTAAKASLDSDSPKILKISHGLHETVSEALKTAATGDTYLNKIESAVKDRLDLGWLSSGKDGDRQKINDLAKREAADDDMQEQVAHDRASLSLETSMASLSQRLGDKLNGFVENSGDFTKLTLALKIPVGSGFSILLNLNGEMERGDNDLTLKMNGSLGASFGIEKLFTVQASFGGYIEAKGKDAGHALELMSYSFYQRAQGKLPATWNDKIWGLGGSIKPGKEAETWADYVTARMQDGDFVESGLLAEIAATLGDTDVLGAGAKITGQTGTRWSKEENQDAIQKSSTHGAAIELTIGAGIIGVDGSLSFSIKGVTPQPTGKTKISLSVGGEVGLDTGMLGVVMPKLINQMKILVTKANDRLAVHLAKDEEAKKALRAASDDQSFGDIVRDAIHAEVDGVAGGVYDKKHERAYGKGDEGSTFSALEKLDGPYKDAQGAAIDAVDGLDPTPDKLAVKIPNLKNSGRMALGLEISYATGDGWDCDVYYKETETKKLNVGIVEASMESGHKTSLVKNSAFAKAKRADEEARRKRLQQDQ